MGSCALASDHEGESQLGTHALQAQRSFSAPAWRGVGLEPTGRAQECHREHVAYLL